MVETYTSKIVAWSARARPPRLCGLRRRAQRLHARQRRGRLHHPERRHRRRVAGRGDGPALDPEGLAGRARRDGRHRGRRHPAPGAQRPHLRTGRPPLLHRPGGLPARRPEARPRLRAGARRHGRAPRGDAERLPQRHRRRAGRERRVGRVVRARVSIASARASRPSRSPGCPRATSPTGSRSPRTATCGSPRSWAAAWTSCGRTARSSTSSRRAASRSTACSTRAT